MAIEIHCFNIKALTNANGLTPKPLGVIFITPGIISFNTQWASLIHPLTGVEDFRIGALSIEMHKDTYICWS